MHINVEQLAAFATGRLAANESGRIEDHLLQCEQCSRQLETLDISHDPLIYLLRAPSATTGESAPNSPPDVAASGNLLTSQSPPSALLSVGRYRIEGELGRGGMGVVYRAYDPTLRRHVALKLIAPFRSGKGDLGDRFRREAEAAARLQHPGIVEVFEYGEHAGTPYCVFELVENGSLSERLARALLSPVQAAELLATLSDAVEFAHRRQVVHRDLKPANVLFTSEGRPKVADFGLAKRLDDDRRQTIEGLPIGSPSYMSPEQAAGQADVGPATDVYALGAILYESLTGRPPFEASTLLATLELVRDAEPQRPSLLQAGIDVDLETICLKCLEKFPSRRYESAAALAMDLRRYLAAEPISARRASWVERLQKWSRRHPKVAILAFSFMLVSLVYLISVTGVAAWLQIALADARQQKAAAIDQAERARRTAYPLNLHRAADLVQIDASRARHLLEDDQLFPRDLRDFAWRYLWGRSNRSNLHWDLPGEVPLRCLAIDPSGKWVAAGDGAGWIRLWSLAAEHRPREQRIHQRAITDLAFAPEGDRLVAAAEDGAVSLWRLEDERAAIVLQREDDYINGVAFSNNGKWLATAHSQGTVGIWDSQSLETLHTLDGHDQSVFRVSFNSDSSLLASGSKDRSLRLWNAPTFAPHEAVVQGEAAVTAVRFHPVQRDLLASASTDGQVSMWNVTDNQVHKMTSLSPRFEATVSGLAFSADGRFLAAASYDHTARVWNVAERQQMLVLRSEAAPSTSVVFGVGEDLLTGNSNGRVDYWDLREDPQHVVVPAAHATALTGLAFLNEGEILASSGYDGAVRLWDTDGQSVAGDGWERATSWIKALGHSSAGDELIWESDGEIHVAAYHPEKGFKVRAVPSTLLLSETLTSDSLGKTIVIADQLGVQAIDSTTGAVRARWAIDQVRCLCYSDTGQTLAVADSQGNLWLGNLCDPRMVRGESRQAEARVRTLAFHPQSKLLVIGTESGVIELADLLSHEPHRRLVGHAGAVTCLAFSPDGRSLASGSEDGEVRLWDAAVGAEEVRWTVSSSVRALAFAPDSAVLACGTKGGEIHLWKAAPHSSTMPLGHSDLGQRGPTSTKGAQ